MEKSGHTTLPSGSTEEARILKAFLASYSLSNRLFPQTRFYFVIDFSSRLDHSSLDRVLRGGAVLVPDAVTRLERMANTRHNDRRVAKPVTADMIRADADKMLRALKDVYDRYATQKPNSSCSEDFIHDCSELKAAVDKLAISPSYLDFISPKDAIGAGNAKVFRSDNCFLVERLAVPPVTAPILVSALYEEIARPLWIVRSAS